MENAFGQQLTEAIKRIKKATGKPIAVIQDELGYAVGKRGGESVKKWRLGERLPKTTIEREKLARALVAMAPTLFDHAWLQRFLHNMEYIHAEALGAELFPTRAPLTDSSLDVQPAGLGLFTGIPAMPKHFVGRDDLLDDLSAKLTGGQSLALAAEGLPGVGKTAMAVMLAHRQEILAHFTDGVLWAGLGPEADVISVQAKWATTLRGDISQFTDRIERQQAIRDLIGQRRLLLVIDDAWQPDAAEFLRCGGPNCGHLLTTRLKDVASDFAEEAINVQPLADDPAFELLYKLAPRVCDEDPEAARGLIQAVGGLPLAIELLGGYLGASRRSLWPSLSRKALDEMKDVQKRLQRAKVRLGSATGKKKTLQETILLSLERLESEDDGQEAIRAFYALGAFAPKPERFSWAAATAVTESEADIIAWLVERNLLEMDEDELTIHQTIADVARIKIDEVATERHQTYYLDVVNDDGEDWQRIESVYGQVKWAWQKLPDDENLLDWVWALDTYQKRRGLWPDYLAWANRGLEITRTQNLRRDEGTLLNNIGRAYDRLGQPEQALDNYNQALSICKEMGHRFGLATTLNNIGEVYRKLGELEQALDYYNQALSIMEEVEDRYGLATTLNNVDPAQVASLKKVKADSLRALGIVLLELGVYARSRAYYEQAMSIYHNIEDKRGVGMVLNNLGAVFKEQGDYTGTHNYWEMALHIFQEIGDRVGEARVLNNLGGLFMDQGDYEAALQYHEEVLQICREIDVRIGECYALLNLGLLHYYQNQYESALDYSRQALQVAQEMGGRRLQGYAFTNVGRALTGAKQPAQAAEAYHSALAIWRELSQNNLVMEAYSELAYVAHLQGDLTEAKALVEKIIEYLEAGNSLDGTESPFRVYLICYHILRATEDARAGAILATAYDLLQERAAFITDEVTRHSFLHNIAVHAELVRVFTAVSAADHNVTK